MSLLCVAFDIAPPVSEIVLLISNTDHISPSPFSRQLCSQSVLSIASPAPPNPVFLQGKHVLVRQKHCPACRSMMARQIISDGCHWQCPDCYKAVSIRSGSFFEELRPTLQKWLHWWPKQCPVKDAAEEMGVSEATAVQVYHWMRDAMGCAYLILK